MRKYLVIANKDLTKHGLEPSPYNEWGSTLICQEGGVMRVVGEDGGEAEDQTFGRDWSWVRQELNEAFAAGMKEFEKESDEGAP